MYVGTYVCMYICVCMYVSVCVCVLGGMYICVCMYMCVSTHVLFKSIANAFVFPSFKGIYISFNQSDMFLPSAVFTQNFDGTHLCGHV
jgi:hypothetical protein